MDNPMYRPPMNNNHENDFLTMLGEAGAPSQKNQRKRGDQPQAQKEVSIKTNGRIDIDELWEDWTPRLLEHAKKPLSRGAERPLTVCMPGLGDQDQATWRLETH